MKFLKNLLLYSCSILSTHAFGQEANTLTAPINDQEETASCSPGCSCGSTQTPLGVTSDHIEDKGKFMLSYTYMNMAMMGNHIGSSSASDADVYKKYMMAPETMNMQMHMAMLMYGITDKFTVMAMGGYATTTMTMNMSDAMMNMPGMVMATGNMTMSSTSSGFTDTKVSALYNFSNNMSRHIVGSLGINLPTGTIKATGTTMLGEGQRLPYDMQLGTGSVGILPDITFVQTRGSLSYGINAGANINLNKNELGYKIGNIYHATAWAGYRFLPFLSASVRVEGIYQDKIQGQDADMDNIYYRESDPTTVAANYGGKWGNVYAGLNFHSLKPVLTKFKVLAEYGLPVYQDLNGTQMALHGTLSAGLQYAF